MGLWKRIAMEIIRRPFRTIMIVSAILVLSVMTMIGGFLQNIVKAAYQEYIRIDGYSIAVESREGAIPLPLKKEILELDHVVGYNATGNLQYNYIPVNFKNIPYQYDSKISVEEMKEITLCGNIDTKFYTSFRNGDMTLKEGEVPDSNQKGVMVDGVLADQNGLKIGDNIELHCNEENKTISYRILGIYETHKAPEIQKSNDMGTYYTSSPNSYVFCDYDSFIEMRDIDSTLSSLTFYVDEYINIDTVYDQIKEIAPERKYLITNCLESELSYYGTVIVELENTANYLLNFTYITSLVILVLMTLLWMRDHYYEAGIYIALGTEKIKIVIYFITEIILIAAASLGLAILIGSAIIQTYGKRLLDMAMSVTNSKFLDDVIRTKAINHAFSYQSILLACGVYLIIIVIATLLSSITIVNYNPRKLFDSE